MTDSAVVQEVGELEILSAGKGDLKITIDKDDAKSVADAKTMITDMLKRGYAIFVYKANGEMTRVKRFDAKKMEYIITEVVEATPEEPRKIVDKAVPVASTKAHAHGRMAGG